MNHRRLQALAAALALGLSLSGPNAGAAADPAAGNSMFVPASDPRFRYGGRIDFTKPESPVIVWEASTVAIDFTGDQASIRFGAVTDQVYFNASVDGVTAILALKEGMPRKPMALSVSGKGLHHLVLFKRSEASAGTAQFEGIEIAAGAEASLPAATRYAMRMEFYGDSITVGACDEDGAKDQWEDRRTHNAAYSYAALTAARFSADYRNISVSGIGLAAGYDDVLVGQTWDRIYPTATSARADLGAWVPDVVLVLLGDNDDSYPRSVKAAFPANFIAKYDELIHAIRAAYPKASIVLLNGGMWAGTNSDALRTNWNAAVAGLEAMDPAISNFTFVHWTDNHPRVADHRAMADELNAWLSRQPFMARPTADTADRGPSFFFRHMMLTNQ